MVRNEKRPLKSLLSGICVAATFASPAAAQFTLKDKVLTVIVSGGVGGGLDSYTRVFMKHFAENLPGKPSVVVQNMPGGGGVQGVQRLYSVMPKDGTAIATSPGGPIKEPLMGATGVNYDLRKFNWVGSLTNEDTACLVWHTSDIKTIEDAKKREVPISATGTASNSTLGPLLVNALLGTKFKPISGYDGGTSMLAVERGEVEGRCTTMNSIRVQNPHWIRENLMRPLVLFFSKPDPDYPDVPKMQDLLKTSEDKSAFAFFQISDEIQDPVMLPPDTPKEVVDAFRRAFDETVKNPAYLAEAAERKQKVAATSGADVEALIAKMYATPPAVIERVKRAITLAKPN